MSNKPINSREVILLKGQLKHNQVGNNEVKPVIQKQISAISSCKLCVKVEAVLKQHNKIYVIAYILEEPTSHQKAGYPNKLCKLFKTASTDFIQNLSILSVLHSWTYPHLLIWGVLRDIILTNSDKNILMHARYDICTQERSFVWIQNLGWTYLLQNEIQSINTWIYVVCFPLNTTSRVIFMILVQ